VSGLRIFAEMNPTTPEQSDCYKLLTRLPDGFPDMKQLILILIALAFVLPAAAQTIYKVVDEDGNVTYTDQKPSDDAEPMDLPELNVLEGNSEPPPVIAESSTEEREPLQLRIVSPENEENIRGTANRLSVNLESNIEIPPTALIVFYIDDEAQDPVQSLSATFEEIPRGTHTLRAELQTPSGRVLAETETITVYMRQASRQHPPPR